MQENSSFDDRLWAQIRKDFGDHLMRQQEFSKARENFEESLQLETNKLDSVYRLAHSLAREAKVTEALKILKSRSTQGKFNFLCRSPTIQFAHFNFSISCRRLRKSF
jgi:Tfp pilus assembly protein PilF